MYIVSNMDGREYHIKGAWAINNMIRVQLPAIRPFTPRRRIAVFLDPFDLRVIAIDLLVESKYRVDLTWVIVGIYYNRIDSDTLREDIRLALDYYIYTYTHEAKEELE